MFALITGVHICVMYLSGVFLQGLAPVFLQPDFIRSVGLIGGSSNTTEMSATDLVFIEQVNSFLLNGAE